MSASAPVFTPVDTSFPGLVVLKPRVFHDSRGRLVKYFHVPALQELGIRFEPQEEFYSVSRKNVLRGLHFQNPPQAHAKMVTCLRGRALDLVTDLRKDSHRYRTSFSFTLTAEGGEIIYIPRGFAHGFLSLEENTVMLYQTDAVRAPECEAGLAWNSVGFDWPCRDPLISERDGKLPPLVDFESPF